MEDKWVGIRESLFGNVEPSVKLAALTTPLDASDPESLVAEAARVSTGIAIKDAIALNKKLISLGHMVPVEFVAFTFMISGISKACSSQISRHRISSIVSSSRRYQNQQPSFVYPGLESISDTNEAKAIYGSMENFYKTSYEAYTQLREINAKKGDARYIVPVGSATSKMWHINARSLRNFLQLRLDPAAEWEIRRLAELVLNIVMHVTPSLFEDIEKKFSTHEKKA